MSWLKWLPCLRRMDLDETYSSFIGAIWRVRCCVLRWKRYSAERGWGGMQTRARSTIRGGLPKGGLRWTR